MTLVRRFRTGSGDRMWSWVFLLPVTLVLLLAAFLPLGYGIVLSFTKYNLTAVNPHPVFVGLQNYLELVRSALFTQAVRNNLMFAGIAVSAELLFGLIIAVMLSDDRNSRALTTVMLIPMVIAQVAAGILWRMMLDRTYGVVNYLLALVGISPVPWLSDYHIAIYSVIFVDVWQFTPFVAVLVLSSIKTLPYSLVESAVIDGASLRRIFFSIVLPLISPVVIVVALIRFIDAFKVFGTVFTMTQGGPGSSTLMLPNYIYQEGLGFFRIGYTSASAVLFIASMLVLSIAFVKLRDYRLGQIA